MIDRIMENNQNQDKYTYIYVGIWLTLVAVSLIGGIILTDGLRHYRLMSDAVETKGRVTLRKPKTINLFVILIQLRNKLITRLEWLIAEIPLLKV